MLAIWWLVLGPVAACTFYEPAYVAIQQAFDEASRARAIAVLTLAAGFSGPIFTPLTGALVEAFDWRDATRVLAAAFLCAAPVAALFVTVRPASRQQRRRPSLEAFRSARLRVFTVGAVLAYGAIEALVLHRIARFQELGFSLTSVTFWAALSGLLTLPGRFLLPVLARRVGPTTVFAAVIAVLAVSAALTTTGEMALSFIVFGLVFGSALPLRAVVMSEWTATAIFGTVMGAQAAMIAFGRAGVPALVGGMHDRLDGYTAAMALITALLAVERAARLLQRVGQQVDLIGVGVAGNRISSSQPASVKPCT